MWLPIRDDVPTGPRWHDVSAHGTGTAGFTYLEVLVAVVILALAALSMGAALQANRDAAERGEQAAIADWLLQDGIAWARSLPRLDPTAPTFGSEAGERAGFDVDDVDDLAGLVEEAPTDRTGAAAGADWRRRFAVESVTTADPTAATTAGGSALLRVVVAVDHRNSEVATGTVWLARTP